MIEIKKPPDKLWFPTLLQVSNNVDTNSWFNMKQKLNPNKISPEKENIKTNYIKTMKFPIYPTKKHFR